MYGRKVTPEDVLASRMVAEPFHLLDCAINSEGGAGLVLTYVFIPEPFCTECQSEELEWVESSGRGVVYSMTTVYRPQRPEFEVPYTVAIVELEEGWHMLTNLVDCPPEEIRVGLPVEVTFRRMSDEVTLPLFRPRADSRPV